MISLDSLSRLPESQWHMVLLLLLVRAALHRPACWQFVNLFSVSMCIQHHLATVQPRRALPSAAANLTDLSIQVSRNLCLHLHLSRVWHAGHVLVDSQPANLAAVRHTPCSAKDVIHSCVCGEPTSGSSLVGDS